MSRFQRQTTRNDLQSARFSLILAERKGADPAVLLRKQRLKREAEWNEQQTLEQEVLEPYLLSTYSTSQTPKGHEMFMERSRRQVQVILQTNDMLQQQLKEQQDLIDRLRRQREERLEEWEQLSEDLGVGKEDHQKVIFQLRQLREQRYSEESRLRARRNELHDRVIELTQDNTRLEKLRSAEDRQLNRQQNAINELQRVIEKLVGRKALFELREREMERDLEETRTPKKSFVDDLVDDNAWYGDDDDEGTPKNLNPDVCECGSFFPPNALFCTVCGVTRQTPLHLAPVVEQRECVCGKKIAPESKYCDNCGREEVDFEPQSLRVPGRQH